MLTLARIEELRDYAAPTDAEVTELLDAAEIVNWLSTSRVDYIHRHPGGVRLIETDCGAMVLRAEGPDLIRAVLAALKGATK